MEDFFAKRKAGFSDLAAKFKKQYKKISLVRVLVFLTGASLMIYAIYLRDAGWALVIFGITFFVFGYVVNYHRRIKEKSLLNEELSKINDAEIKRLHLEIEEFDAGAGFMDEKHPFAYDLDIFGRHSLYQLINRAVTSGGKDCLAHDLKFHFEAEEIVKRQRAVKELKDRVDWRQHFQANGSHAREIDSFASRVQNWVTSAYIFLSNKLWKPLVISLWLVVLVVLCFILMGKINFYWIFLVNVANAALLGPRLKKIEKFGFNVEKTTILLSAYRKMLLSIEELQVSDPYLNELREKLFLKKTHASGAIKRLENIMNFLDNRANLFYLILNSFFLLDVYLIYKAEEWKEEYGRRLLEWLDVVATFEAISSFSAFAYSNPSFCFPEIASKTHFISAENIAHPLLSEEKRVSNDVSVSGKGAVILITGSNMAGKSTFLRTMGINLVLAQAGAPVCASSFTFSLCSVYSGMRTKDNLEESVSTFYAELIRINKLIQIMDQEKPVFYLLDEILKGTNSHDRHIGAGALIKQLSNSNSFGLVSSHDIELTQLATEISQLENFSFHSQEKNEEIHFDYKLRKGPCTSFNAVMLMKKMGISILE